MLHDREFAMLGSDGRFVNGKRTGRVNQLAATYDLNNYQVNFTERGADNMESFNLLEENEKISAYLSDFFQLEVAFLHNKEGRLLDVPDRSCVTILSEASLSYLSAEMHHEDIEDMRLRFRANIEISGVPAFWEERLARLSREPVQCRIGDVSIAGNSLRARCNVPPKDPLTGELDKKFVAAMLRAREKNIPDWSCVGELDSLYYLSVDCSLPASEKGKRINIGDELVII